MPATSTRPFRILALPLARLPRPPQPSSQPSQTPPSDPAKYSSPLLLFQALQPDTSPDKGPKSLPTRALQKASDSWLKLGARPKDSWMYWFYARGEGLMDRIEYEEWSLKGIVEGQGVKIATDGQEQELIEIPLLKPRLEGEVLPPLLPKLHRLLLHRIPYHRKMMVRSLVFAPVTFPFALIPVIPNFPFFYILWRAWSHYKAWRGASYLESLLKLGMIVEKPSPELDEVYRSTGRGATEEGSEERAPDQTSSDGVKLGVVSEKARVQEGAKSSGASELPEQAKGNGPAPDGTSTPQSMIYQPAPAMSPTSAGGKTSSPRHPSVLLGLGQAPLLAKAFGLKPNEVMDVNRALEQADGRAKAADKAKSQEGVDSERDEKQAPGTTWRGNLHR